jgi:hypothetical protein
MPILPGKLALTTEGDALGELMNLNTNSCLFVLTRLPSLASESILDTGEASQVSEESIFLDED